MNINDWQDMKFGVLIHWGPYSQWGVFESWTLCQESDPWCARPPQWADNPVGYEKAYEQLPDTFAAPAFDPKQWAASCAAAGMKYLVFTTKHHDGFAMYDTALSDYKVTNTPLGRDVTREVFDAFRAQGLNAGVYFSKADWHSDDYWVRDRPRPDRFANYSTAEEPARWHRFKEFTHDQIKELLSDYGLVDILWLDGGWVREPREDLDMPALAAEARSLQPQILVVDRDVHGPQEEYSTPEQTVPDQLQPFPWESCVTLGPMWYTAGPDETYKSVTEVVHLLCQITARGGNLLLGLGPDHTGAIPEAIYERLAGIGAWLDVNGAAIYGSRPIAPYEQDSLLFTTRGGDVYAIRLLTAGQEAPEVVTFDWRGKKPERIDLLGTDHPIVWGWRSPQDKDAPAVISVTMPEVDVEHAYVLALRY